MNGFLAPGHGLICLDSRADVVALEVQRILQLLHPHGGVVCACRLREGTALSLEIIGQPDGKFRLDRRSISDPHAEECIFRLDDDFELHPPSPSLVFDLTGRTEGSARAFRHLARHFLSGVHSDRFIASLHSGRELGGAELRTLFSALTGKISDRSHYPSYSMLTEAAARELTLSWGLLRGASEVVPRDASVPLLLDIWSEMLGGVESRITVVTECAWTEALIPLQVLTRLVSGPYLFLAASNREGVVVRLSLHPVYLDATHIIPVDSHTERKRAAQLVVAGNLPYHPLRLDDFRRVCRAIAAYTGRSISAPIYRPDFIYVTAGELIGEEIRGFPPGRLPAYDAHFELKRCSGFAESLGIHCIDGWSLPEPASSALAFAASGLVVATALESLSLLDINQLEQSQSGEV